MVSLSSLLLSSLLLTSLPPLFLTKVQLLPSWSFNLDVQGLPLTLPSLPGMLRSLFFFFQEWLLKALAQTPPPQGWSYVSMTKS